MDISVFDGKTILITGASGLIGRSLVTALSSGDCKIIALVRDRKKAEKIFGNLPQGNIEYLVSDVCDLKPCGMGVDYIIHGANQTASKKFVEEPVEVILNSIKGTKNVLEFARCNPVKSIVYLSTMEIYGAPSCDDKIGENHPCNLDSMKVRSSYPESKRACECLCASYSSEYGLPVKVVRLTQTFGKGVEYNDGRVFAEFARCVIEGRDIVLKTKGETKRNYLSTDDAVGAILTVLRYGKDGEAYNAANEQTYCSVYEMAQMVAGWFGQGKTGVRICESEDTGKLGYAPTLKMNLDCGKLKGLGWTAVSDLYDMFKDMIDYMKENK